MFQSDLADLLRGAVVRIDIEGRPSGTGFFVAPGHVLTCAHVIESATFTSSAPLSATLSSPIQVVDARGRSHAITAAPVIEQNADLAWLRLPAAPTDVSIALIFRGVSVGDELWTYGFPPDKSKGVPATFKIEGLAGGPPPLIKFKEGQVQPGMSGAPLLNLRTGGVCGVLRRTRDERTALGGYGIPVEVIENCGFYRELQRPVPSVQRVKSEWMDHLSAEQRRLIQPGSTSDEFSATVEFVINVGESRDGWVVDTTAHPGEHLGPVPVDLNVVRAEVARLFRAWKSQRRIDDTEQAKLLGQVLYRAVLPSALADDLERRMFDSPDTQVNVSLHFTRETAQDLVHLPWEQLYVPGREARAGVAIGMNDRVTLTRVLTTEPQNYLPATVSRMKVLLVEAPHSHRGSASGGRLSRPSSQDTAVEIDRVLSTHGDRIELIHKGAISPEQLDECLSSESFTVIHYVGYGRFYGNVDELALDNGHGNIIWLGPDKFASLLDPPLPRLVVLQACTEPGGDHVPGDLTVLAKHLLQRGVDAVIACQFPVLDMADAVRLVDLLYGNLLNGMSVRVAVQRLRKRMKFKPWTQPALFIRHPGDLHLLVPPRTPEIKTSPWIGGAND